MAPTATIVPGRDVAPAKTCPSPLPTTLDGVDAISIAFSDFVESLVARLAATIEAAGAGDASFEAVRQDGPWRRLAEQAQPCILDLDADELNTLLAHLAFRETPAAEDGLCQDDAVLAILALADGGGPFHNECAKILKGAVLPCDGAGEENWAAMQAELPATEFESAIDEAVAPWVLQYVETFDRKGFLDVLCGYREHAQSLTLVAMGDQVLVLPHDHGDAADVLSESVIPGSDYGVPDVFVLPRAEFGEFISVIVKSLAVADDRAWRRSWKTATKAAKPAAAAIGEGLCRTDFAAIRHIQASMAQQRQQTSSCVTRAILNLILCGLLVRHTLTPEPAFTAVGRRILPSRAGPWSRPTSIDAYPHRFVRARLQPYFEKPTRPDDASPCRVLAGLYCQMRGPENARGTARVLHRLPLNRRLRLELSPSGDTLPMLVIRSLGNRGAVELEKLLCGWHLSYRETAFTNREGETVPRLIARTVGPSQPEIAARIVARLPLRSEDLDRTNGMSTLEQDIVDTLGDFAGPLIQEIRSRDVPGDARGEPGELAIEDGAPTVGR